MGDVGKLAFMSLCINYNEVIDFTQPCPCCGCVVNAHGGNAMATILSINNYYWI